jgi:hypothetical protein
MIREVLRLAAGQPVQEDSPAEIAEVNHFSPVADATAATEADPHPAMKLPGRAPKVGGDVHTVTNVVEQVVEADPVGTFEISGMQRVRVPAEPDWAGARMLAAIGLGLAQANVMDSEDATGRPGQPADG